MSPEQALAGRVSSRAVPPTRLHDAFRQEKRLKAHPKTGEVEIQQVTYLVPDELRGQRLTFLVDPPAEVPPLVVHPESEEPLPLRRAAIAPDPAADTGSAREPWGPGPLQAIYDAWNGKPRPLCEPGFGLPELYSLLGDVVGRHVPKTDAEAALIGRVYGKIGPLPRKATEAAMRAIHAELGSDRPIKTYLDALAQRVRASNRNTQTERKTP